MAAKGFLAEIRRRKVLPTALFYAAFAWAAIEVVTTLLPVFGGRDVVVRILVIAILAGLPVAIVISWIFDLTPSGLQRTDRNEHDRIRDDSDQRGTAAPARPLSRPPPSPTTPLVARDREVAELVSLLEGDTRVVTITGPGGTGKTRVAIAVAGALQESFGSHVAYVELAAVQDPAAVVPTIAGALGVKEAETRSLAEGLATVIGDRRLLLVLDNLEQVIDAASDLARLLARCSELRLLATSRAPLRIAGEAEVALKPLGVPPEGTVSPEELATVPSVALFLDRTRRARPSFELTAGNAHAVAAICRRLDGLPLALELAAARLRTLEPDALLDRLGKALDVLTTGARDLPERQRTLRGTIDWSHSLLDDPEQRLFRRVAVFAGGWPREAVAPVCANGGPPDDAFDSLVEKHLVHPLDDPRRFGMLETIREYAGDRLDESGERGEIGRRHAFYFQRFTEAMYHDLRNGAQVASLERGDHEAANIEEALAHLHQCAAAGDAEAGSLGLRMCGDLWMHWHIRGLHIRARDWSRRFLEATRPPEPGMSTPGASRDRARALAAAAVASVTLGDPQTGIAEIEEGRAVAPPDDDEVAGNLAIMLGVAHLTTGAFEAAGAALDEAVRRLRSWEGAWELGIALTFKGITEAASGNPEAARAALDEALSLQRPIDDHEGMGASIGGLAALEAAAGNRERALELYGEALDHYHTIGDRPEEARILDALAWTTLALDRTGEARDHFTASLRAYEQVGSVRGIGIALLGLAATEAAEGRPERAVRIAAASVTFSEREGVANDYASNTSAPDYLDPARGALDPEAVARLEAEGRELSVEAAVRLALDPEPETAPA
jgi:predicted ATPase